MVGTVCRVTRNRLTRGRLALSAALATGAMALTAPAGAGAFGLQGSFSAQGFGCCGESIFYVGLAFTGNGDLWQTSGATRVVTRYGPGGLQLGQIPTGVMTQGMTVDRANGDVYVVTGEIHGNHPVMHFTSAGVLVKVYGAPDTGGPFGGDHHEGFNIAVNETTKQTYGIGYGSGGQVVRFAADGSVLRILDVGVEPSDIEVDQPTGDVLVSYLGNSRVVRYDASLDNPQTVLQGSGARTSPIGISLAPDGNLWVNWRGSGQTERIAPNGTVLGAATVPEQMMDVEADAKGGAYVAVGNGGRIYYVATDPPVAAFTSSLNGAIPAGAHLDFTSTSSDPDGTIASQSWDLDGNGTYGDATTPASGITFTTAGPHVVRLKVTDNDGATAIVSRTFTVVAQAPTASFTVSPAVPAIGQTITLTSTSTDPDGTIAHTDWDLDDDGQADDATGSPVTTSFATAGDHVVRLRVQDNDGNVVTKETTIGIPAVAAAFAVDDVAIGEGDSGTRQLVFHVTRTGSSTQPASVDYAVGAGTASDGTDFASRALATLTFGPGQTAKTVGVPVFGDVVEEDDETVILSLSDPSGATVADASGTGTITDDDAAPTVSVRNTEVTEGPGAVAQVTIGLDGPVTERTAAVHLATSDGTAQAGGDYTAVSQNATIVPPARTATVNVPITNDDVSEPDETVGLTLTGSGPLPLGTTAATLTIHDDGDKGPITVVQAPPSPVPEAGPPVSAIVGIPFPQAAPVMLSWRLDGGDASQSTDWAAREGTVTIPAGQTQASISLQPVDDQTDELDTEPWVLHVAVASGPANGTLDMPVGMADDDPDAKPVICPVCEHPGGDLRKARVNVDLTQDPDVTTAVGNPRKGWVATGWDRPSEEVIGRARFSNGLSHTDLCNQTIGIVCLTVTTTRYPSSWTPFPYGHDGLVGTVQQEAGGDGPNIGTNVMLIGMLRLTLWYPVAVNGTATTQVSAEWGTRTKGRQEESLEVTLVYRKPSDSAYAAHFGPNPAYPGDGVSCSTDERFPKLFGHPDPADIVRGGETVGTGWYSVRSSDVGATLSCKPNLPGGGSIVVAQRTVPPGAPVIATGKPLTVTGGVVAPVPVNCTTVVANCHGTLEYRLAPGGGTTGGKTARASAAATKKAKSRRSGTLVGRATFRAKGRKAKVKVKLNKAGRAAFAKTGTLSVIAVVTSGKKVTDRSLVLRAPTPKITSR